MDELESVQSFMATASDDDSAERAEFLEDVCESIRTMLTNIRSQLTFSQGAQIAARLRESPFTDDQRRQL